MPPRNFRAAAFCAEAVDCRARAVERVEVDYVGKIHVHAHAVHYRLRKYRTQCAAFYHCGEITFFGNCRLVRRVVAVDVFKIVVGFCQRLFEFVCRNCFGKIGVLLDFVADIAADVDVLHGDVGVFKRIQVAVDHARNVVRDDVVRAFQGGCGGEASRRVVGCGETEDVVVVVVDGAAQARAPECPRADYGRG